VNKNWPRWIYSSVAKHFSDKCIADGLPIYIETSPRDTNKLQDWVEFRLDGPFFTGHTKNEWGIIIEVNLVISSAKNERNNYRVFTNQGLICGYFAQEIPVFKLGVGVDDDQSLLTCLQLITEGREKLVVSNFGQIDTAKQLLQSTVEGHYRANLIG